MMTSDPSGPKATDLFEMQRRVTRVFFQVRVGPIGEPLNFCADSGDRDRSVRRIVITRSGDRDRCSLVGAKRRARFSPVSSFLASRCRRLRGRPGLVAGVPR